MALGCWRGRKTFEATRAHSNRACRFACAATYAQSAFAHRTGKAMIHIGIGSRACRWAALQQRCVQGPWEAIWSHSYTSATQAIVCIGAARSEVQAAALWQKRWALVLPTMRAQVDCSGMCRHAVHTHIGKQWDVPPRRAAGAQIVAAPAAHCSAVHRIHKDTNHISARVYMNIYTRSPRALYFSVGYCAFQAAVKAVVNRSSMPACLGMGALCVCAPVDAVFRDRHRKESEPASSSRSRHFL